MEYRILIPFSDEEIKRVRDEMRERETEKECGTIVYHLLIYRYIYVGRIKYYSLLLYIYNELY